MVQSAAGLSRPKACRLPPATPPAAGSTRSHLQRFLRLDSWSPPNSTSPNRKLHEPGDREGEELIFQLASNRFRYRRLSRIIQQAEERQLSNSLTLANIDARVPPFEHLHPALAGLERSFIRMLEALEWYKRNPPHTFTYRRGDRLFVRFLQPDEPIPPREDPAKNVETNQPVALLSLDVSLPPLLLRRLRATRDIEPIIRHATAAGSSPARAA